MTKLPLVIPSGALLAKPKSNADNVGEKLRRKIQEKRGKGGKFAFALDATGSMEQVIKNTKNHIQTIIQRAQERSGADVELRIYAYRDYDNLQNLLEKSDSTSNSKSIAEWLGRLKAGGGADHEEAMEFALKVIQEDAAYNGVFVIGDAKARTQSELARIRPNEKTAHLLAKELFNAGTRVHALWVPGGGGDQTDYKYFQDLAKLGGGSSGRLDGGDDILDMAVMAIIEALVGAAAVEKYAKDFHLTDNAKKFKTLLIENKK